jgi:Putative beta-barrel porin-2, OmpL-like. bbp2
MQKPNAPALCTALLLITQWPSASAQVAAEPPDGSSGLSPLVAIEQATGIKVQGYAQVGYSRNNQTTSAQAKKGHSNFPVVGPNDEGFQLNEVHLAFEKPMRSNLLPRITPLPGPVPWEFSWGFRGELLYGRDGLPAQMLELDSKWGINKGKEGVPPGTDHQNYLAMPQLFAEFYFPVAQGVTAMAGRFGSGVGRDIPPDWRPGPSFFYSKTYAMVSQPDQVAGALVSANLLRNDAGFLAGELGVVNGRQNWSDNNDDKSLIGALRWRSGDMQTWVDYSFMRGNEQNKPGSAPQMPIARLISPRGQMREHHALSVSLHPSDTIELAAEMLYGRQAGDGKMDTVDVLTGPGFSGATYSGVNAQLTFKASPSLRYGLRLETFKDAKGVALFPVTAASGTFNALTLGVRYDLHKNVVLRSELRHDWQSGNKGVKAFAGGAATKQTTVSADVLVYF